jgi:hypothetical protein
MCVLLYKSKPGELDIAEVAQVDYIIAYSCKGNATKEELTKLAIWSCTQRS